MPTTIAISARLRAIRRASKLTQRDLAERLGCSAKTIANIEGGRRGASVTIMAKWAEACGLTFTVEFRRLSDPEWDTQLAAQLMSSSPRVREAVGLIVEGADGAPEASLLALEGHIRTWSRVNTEFKTRRRGRGAK